MPAKLLLVQNWVKWPNCPNQQQGPLLETSYIALLSVMTTLHYHRLYQISSLEANLNLEDMKQLCVDRYIHRQSHSHRYTLYPPKLIIKSDLF